jgi:hypothetical protein
LSEKVTKLDEYLQKGYDSFNRLPKIYEQNIGLINELKIRSKTFMDDIADIEEGVSLGDKNPDSNLNLLLKNIQDFNSNIQKQSKDFSSTFESCMEHFQNALKIFEKEGRGLTKILEARKKLLFTVKILNKLMQKVNSLQHMNSILFSIPTSLKDTEKEYNYELKDLHTTMVRAEDRCRWLIREIENLI